MENKLDWKSDPNKIIKLLIIFFPLGLYYMWKNELWSFETRVKISLIFPPLGLYLMWKNKLWSKKTRWIVTVVSIILISAGGGENKLDNKEINKILNIEWHAKNSGVAYGGYASMAYAYTITKSENGYTYQMKQQYIDVVAGKNEITQFTGDMDDKYTTWEGVRANMLVKRKFWKFKGDVENLAIIIPKDGFLPNSIELQQFNSGGVSPSNVLISKH